MAPGQNNGNPASPANAELVKDPSGNRPGRLWRFLRRLREMFEANLVVSTLSLLTGVIATAAALYPPFPRWIEERFRQSPSESCAKQEASGKWKDAMPGTNTEFQAA